MAFIRRFFMSAFGKAVREADSPQSIALILEDGAYLLTEEGFKLNLE